MLSSLVSPVKPIETLEQFEQALINHDWFYQYSDDHRVWRAGEAAIERIRSAMSSLQNAGFADQVSALWELHCPWSETNKAKQ
jgi:hypothetical protein